MPFLANDDALAHSEIVANSEMNRDRGIAGPNSYARDLSFDLLSFLRKRLQEQGETHWLDLCCGTGRALIEAGAALKPEGEADRFSFTGIDLAPMFYPVPEHLPFIRLEARPLLQWEPQRSYDLITCVHGLHYIGDKLELIRRAVASLSNGGIFLAHLDPANLKLDDGGSDAILRTLRRHGFAYDRRKHLLSCKEKKVLQLPYRYLGADDTSGPNFTGQPAVTSYYTRTE